MLRIGVQHELDQFLVQTGVQKQTRMVQLIRPVVFQHFVHNLKQILPQIVAVRVHVHPGAKGHWKFDQILERYPQFPFEYNVGQQIDVDHETFGRRWGCLRRGRGFFRERRRIKAQFDVDFVRRVIVHGEHGLSKAAVEQSDEKFSLYGRVVVDRLLVARLRLTYHHVFVQTGDRLVHLLQEHVAFELFELVLYVWAFVYQVEQCLEYFQTRQSFDCVRVVDQTRVDLLFIA